MKPTHVPAFAASLVLVALTPACAQVSRTAGTAETTAVLQAGEWGKVYRGGYVAIAGVQGTDTSWRLRSDVTVTPGDHTAIAYVFLCEQSTRHCHSVAQAALRFRAAAGHVYRLAAHEQGHGSNRFSVWLTDLSTGEQVGASPSS